MSGNTMWLVPAIGPDFGRTELEAPEGLSVEAIVALALPGMAPEHRRRARVWLVSDKGETLLAEPSYWPRIYPRTGVRVMIRPVPGKDPLRNVLLIAVSIAALAIGQVWVGPMLAGLTGSALLGQIGAGVATAVLGVAGSMLVNALVPPSTPSVASGQAQQSEKPLYQISGWRNQQAPDGVVPSILGKVRVAPVFAAPSYSEIVGDEQYVRALFTFGYGPVELSELKIGETSIESFDDIQTEIRDGYDSDEKVTLYPSQVIEESLGVELRRDRIRNSSGTVTGTGPITPATRFTAGDATKANVILHFPGGLISYQSNGKAANQSVSIRIRQRPASGGSWETVKTLKVTARKREGFFRQHRWALPSRGRWEIELARLTDESLSANVSDRCSWLALQSYRPEYPLNFGSPLSLVAVRIKATYQLNSTLDTFNAVAERLLPDWDHETETWVTRATRNPASHYRHALQGPENAFPEPDSALDLEALQDWHDFCREKSLKYDRDRSFEASTWDALAEIAGAGRATPRYDGAKWSVVIDRPQELVVAHVNSRNSRDFTWSRTYIDPPDAFRVPFLDETADWQQRERIVRWPGYTGDITTTEQLTLPGKTDPDEVWIEARRRQYEVIYRPDIFTAVQDGAVRTATRGDFVKGSYEKLQSTMAALRVRAVRDQAVTLDGYVTMEAGTSYAIRFMKQVGTGDAATFESTLRSVRTVEGETDTVQLTGSGDTPLSGDLVQFGVSGQESIDLVVSGVQAGEKMTNVLTMLAQAPEIDTLTDAEVPPEWNGRAGSDAEASIAVPGIPVVSQIETHYDGTADGLTVTLTPGDGEAATTFTIRHRENGTTTWVEVTEDAGAGGLDLTGYADGDVVEMQTKATSEAGYSSDWSSAFTVPVPFEAEDAPLPIATGSVAGGTGDADFTLSTPNDTAIAEVRLSYSASSDGSSATEIVTFTATANAAYARTETVPAGSWYFFAETLTAGGTPSSAFSLGQETIL